MPEPGYAQYLAVLKSVCRKLPYVLIKDYSTKVFMANTLSVAEKLTFKYKLERPINKGTKLLQILALSCYITWNEAFFFTRWHLAWFVQFWVFFFSSSAGFILVVRVNKYFIYTLTKKGGVELLLYRLSIKLWNQNTLEQES